MSHFLSFIYIFSFITHTKSSKIILLESQTIISPLAFTEKLFYFYKYFHRTEGFLNRLVVYNKQYIELRLFSKMVEVKKGVILNGR
jgi:hypothetical protein